MMMYWREDYGSMGAGWIFMALFFVVVILLLTRLFRTGKEKLNDPKSSLQILQERYARGEVGREEYEQKRADLEK